MKELALLPRQSGRTTTLLMTMIEEMDMHDSPVHLVVGSFCIGQSLKNSIRYLNGDSSRVNIVVLESLYTLQGVDARNIYAEHTSYEMANSTQLKQLYAIEDAKDSLVFVPGPSMT